MLEKQALRAVSSPQVAATASSRLRVCRHSRRVADVRVAVARTSEVRMESRILRSGAATPDRRAVVVLCDVGCPGLLAYLQDGFPDLLICLVNPSLFRGRDSPPIDEQRFERVRCGRCCCVIRNGFLSTMSAYPGWRLQSGSHGHAPRN